MSRLRGAWGESWSYDTSRAIGDPSAFGVVYEGQGANGLSVAIKIIKGSGKVYLDRLRIRELEVATKLRGQPVPHLIKTLDVASTAGDVAVVMERAEISLGSWLKSKRPAGLAADEALPVLRDIAAGLRELHLLKIFHRDLKPDNVLRHEGTWKLADFGIAHDAEIGTQSPTFRGWGTRAYMAPELFDMVSPNAQTDLYALGCVAYELLLGRPPFTGEEIERQHRLATPPALPETVHPGLRRLVVRLMAKDPSGRPQSALDVEEQLGRISAGSLTSNAGGLAEQARRFAETRAADEQARATERDRSTLRGTQWRQALSASQALLEEALPGIEQHFPDVGLFRLQNWPSYEESEQIWTKPQPGWSPDGTGSVEFRFRGADAWMEVLHYSREYSPTTPIAAGVVRGISSRSNWWRLEGKAPGGVPALANIVARLKGDRLVWELVRFKAAAEPEPWGRPQRMRGLRYPDLKTYFGSLTFKTETATVPFEHAELTADHIAALFGEVLALPRDADGSWW